VTTDQDVQTVDGSAGALWLVVSADGLQVAGTADVPGAPLALSDLDFVRELTRADGRALHTGDAAALTDVVQLTRTASSWRAADRTSSLEVPLSSDEDVEFGAPLLLRVDDGHILGWSHSSERMVLLEDRHVEMLAHLASHDTPAAPADLIGTDPRSSATLGYLLEHGWVRAADPPAVSVAVQIRSATVDPTWPSSDGTLAERGAGPHDATTGGAPDPPPGAGSPGRLWTRLRRGIGRRRQRPVDAGGTERRTPVWPVTCADTEVGNALGLGMLIAAATAYEDGRLAAEYDFRPIRITAADAFEDVSTADTAGVLLLSTYIWSLGANLELAAQVKDMSPQTVVIIGGPSAPKYEQDADDFLRRYPQVDVIVRGEGEATISEVLAALAGDLDRLDALTEVDGLTVRTGDRVVRTPDRARLEDLNVVPSPYLTGLFDHLPAHQGIWAVETNRGCPYGCTFCDWGSATKSRIRKFDMERVTAELDWLSHHGVQAIFVADANFGIFERDLAIVRHVAALHAERGAPASFIASFAKNTTKYTVPIIRTLIDAGLSGDVAIAFQTTDDATLDNISRSNIKIETYDQLARDVRADGLPILADIMLGLPGSTLETLKTDLQHCVDSDVTARVFGTMVLPNSPMNDPDYRELHRIRTDSYDQVISTTSFEPEDREEMVRFRDVFRWADHFGVLRHVLRWEAHRSGDRELDVLWEIAQLAPERPTTYPLLAFMVRSGRRYLIEPMSWRAFYREVGAFLTRERGAVDDAELRTVLTVQEALMPSASRSFPETVRLDHDYVSFYREVLRPSEGPPAPRRLSDYPPTELVVDDPHRISPGCLREMFQIEHSPEGARSLRHEGDFWQAFNWELQSPLERALRTQYYDVSNSLPVLEKGTAPLTATQVTLSPPVPSGN
jgi:radical SAM superfamily enzyme YgiQ (UPF0313 family)